APVIPLLGILTGTCGFGLPDWHTEAGRALLILRMERVWAGLMVGGALAAAGVVLQALLRNPLAEPYVLGVSGGSALGAGAAILFGVSASIWTVPLAAFAAGAATLALVVRLAQDDEGVPSIYGLLLSGVIVSSVCSGLLMFMLSIAPAEGIHNVLWWMLGNLQMPARPLLTLCSGLVLAGMGIATALAPELNALTLGGDTAHHLGVRTKVAVAAGLLLATVITASAVATAGLIGFVGLVVPHVVRSLIGPDHRRLIPGAALAGGLFLAACDMLARTVLAPREIPVGVITALAGGPFFLWILRQRRKSGWAG
ncbi:MAG: iron ABC transporter permease, partial [Kiritimatiellia bacterium]